MTTNKTILTLADARKIAQGAETEANKNNWPVVIAIVDDSGHLLYLQRLDGVQYGSIDVAMHKARAAIAFKRPTKVWEENIVSGNMRYLNLPGTIPIEGGLPITENEQFIGAIGISGVRSHQDAQIAQAGIDYWVAVVPT